MTKFSRFCQTVQTNAANYKTAQACELMVARVKREWAKAGSYGCEVDDRRQAISALQDRHLALTAKDVWLV